MPITDNLIVKVQPDAADTFIKNLIDDSNLSVSGAGTITIVDDAGLKGWQVVGQRYGTFTGGGLGYEGGGMTIAARIKIPSRGNDFNHFLAIANDINYSSSLGARIGNPGTSTGGLRCSEIQAASGSLGIGTPPYTTGTYFTAVIRLRDSSYNGGQHALFLKQTSRSSNNPDYTVASGAVDRSTFGGLDHAVFSSTGQTTIITDLLVWKRDLTDAECAAVADDIRGALVTGSAINGTVGDAAATGSSATVNQEVRIAGSVGDAVAQGFAASVSNSNDTFITGTVGDASATGAAAALSVNVTISALVADAAAVGMAATVSNDTLFRTEPLINNTGSILANQAVVWTWFPGGRVGSLDLITAIDGSGTTGSDGRLSINGLATGSGFLMVAVLNTNATDDAVYYEGGTVT